MMPTSVDLRRAVDATNRALDTGDVFAIAQAVQHERSLVLMCLGSYQGALAESYAMSHAGPLPLWITNHEGANHEAE